MKSKQLLIILVFIICALFLLSGCTRTTAASSWPGYSVSEETAYLSYGVQTFALDLANGSELWKYPSEVDRARQVFAAPAFGEGLVVVGDFNGSLTGLDSSNGVKQWVFDGAKDRFIASALIDGDTVFAANSDHYLYALNTDGDFLWKFKTEGPNWTKPVSDDGSIYFASMDHSFYAIEKGISNNQLAQAEDGSKTLIADPSWSIDLGMAVVADPVIQDGIAYVATIEGVLSAIDTDGQEILWKFTDNGELGAVWGAPVVTDDVVFVADINGNIYGINISDGSALWPSPFKAGGKVVGGGVFIDDGAVFANDEGKLFILSAEKEPRTITNLEDQILSPLGFSGENIIVSPASAEALLTAIDLNGFEVWSFLPAE